MSSITKYTACLSSFASPSGAAALGSLEANLPTSGWWWCCCLLFREMNTQGEFVRACDDDDMVFSWNKNIQLGHSWKMTLVSVRPRTCVQRADQIDIPGYRRCCLLNKVRCSDSFNAIRFYTRSMPKLRLKGSASLFWLCIRLERILFYCQDQTQTIVNTFPTTTKRKRKAPFWHSPVLHC